MTYRRFRGNAEVSALLPATSATFATKSDRERREVAEVGGIAGSNGSIPVFVDQSAWEELDWQIAYDERAAILEHDEGLARAAAGRLARQQIDEQRRRRCH
jgi:hypothetical protein